MSYSKYVFSGHESFPCKTLWLKKGYDFVVQGKDFNSPEAVIDLGDNIKFSDALRAVGLYHSHRTDKSLASFNDSSVIVFRDDPAVETYCFQQRR